MGRQTVRTGDDLPLIEEPALDDTGVRVFEKKRPRRVNRFLRTASARRALADMRDGYDYELATNGEFSLLDLVLVLLDRTGPADVAISTWSAGLYDVEVANRFVSTGLIKSLRLVLDVSFRNNRGSRAYSTLLMDIFGEDAIRTTRTHAKWVTVRGADRCYSVSSSANLNENKRLELFYLSDDPERCAWYEAMADELFEDVKPGWNPDTGAPALHRIDPSATPVRKGTARASTVPLRVGNGAD